LGIENLPFVIGTDALTLVSDALKFKTIGIAGGAMGLGRLTGGVKRKSGRDILK
jgi:hypothetical protein